MKVLYIDTETTGLIKPQAADLSSQPHIIDIGVVWVEDGAIKETISQLVKPPVPIPERVTQITGITDDELKDQPTFTQLIPELVRIFRDADYIVAHNAAFDTGVFGYEMKRAGALADDLAAAFSSAAVVCTVEEFTPIFGRKAKLTEVYEYVLGTTLDEKHRALSDAMDLYKVCATAGIPA